MNALIHIMKCKGVVRFSYSLFHKCPYYFAVERHLQSFQKRIKSTVEHDVTLCHERQWIAPPQLKSFPKRICFGSCSSQHDGDLSYWDRIIETRPDLILLMGDNVYAPPKTQPQDIEENPFNEEDNNIKNRYNSEGSRRRSIMHASYQKLGANASFLRASGSIPILPTLDDNDYNWRNLDAHAMTKEEMNQELEAAKQAFLHFFQIPPSDARWNLGRGVYTSYDFYLRQDGSMDTWCSSSSNEPYRPSSSIENIVWRLQIILLDVRRQKSPFVKRPVQTDEDTEDIGIGPYVASSGDNDTMLGARQWKWLEAQLTEVKMIPPNLRIFVSPIQVLSDGQHGWDCWSLFPRERERLLSLLQSQNSPTILLSGDRHVAAFYHPEETFAGNDLVEVMSSSLTHSVPKGILDHETDSRRRGDFIHENNFGVLDIGMESLYRLSIHCAKTGKSIRQYSSSLSKALSTPSRSNNYRRGTVDT